MTSDNSTVWIAGNDFESRWRGAARKGFTAIPQLLLEQQGELGLDFADLGLLIQLISFWWSADREVYPARSTLAKRANIDERTIQRRVRRLEKAGFIEVERHPRKANRYTFNGLRQKLTLTQVHARRATSSNIDDADFFEEL